MKKIVVLIVAVAALSSCTYQTCPTYAKNAPKKSARI